MIDKVASVLCFEAFSVPREDSPAEYWETMSDRTKAIYRRAAIAVIKAMRKPTNKMLLAGVKYDYAGDCWKVMIDAALIDKSPKATEKKNELPVEGLKRRVEADRVCFECMGSGKINDADCEYCNGTGKLANSRPTTTETKK